MATDRLKQWGGMAFFNCPTVKGGLLEGALSASLVVSSFIDALPPFPIFKGYSGPQNANFQGKSVTLDAPAKINTIISINAKQACPPETQSESLMQGISAFLRIHHVNQAPSIDRKTRSL